MIASFLVEGPDGLVLFETGPESCRENLLQGISGLGFSPDEVRAVFVTHIHLDHSGGAGWWAGREIPVYVHPRGAKHLIDPAKLEASARQVYGDAFDSLWGGIPPAREEWVRVIDDGSVTRMAGLEVRTIETPGHAFHHHAYRVGDCLFTGDAAGARLSGQEYISVTSAPPQFNLEHTLASIEKLEAESVESLFLTHFGEVTDPVKHLEDYREAVEMNVAFVEARLGEGMDGEALQVAYEAFNLEQAFRLEVPMELWLRYQSINGTDMCADGIRIFYEKLNGSRNG